MGDFIQGGVVISNSEVGLGRVEIRELDYRLVCTNGMVGASLFKKTHLGAALDDDEALWADDTRRVSDDALMLKVRDMIAEAVKLIGRLNQVTARHVGEAGDARRREFLPRAHVEQGDFRAIGEPGLQGGSVDFGEHGGVNEVPVPQAGWIAVLTSPVFEHVVPLCIGGQAL